MRYSKSTEILMSTKISTTNKNQNTYDQSGEQLYNFFAHILNTIFDSNFTATFAFKQYSSYQWTNSRRMLVNFATRELASFPMCIVLFLKIKRIPKKSCVSPHAFVEKEKIRKKPELWEIMCCASFHIKPLRISNRCVWKFLHHVLSGCSKKKKIGQATPSR